MLLIAHGSRHALASADLPELAARLVERGDDLIVDPCFLELAEPEIGPDEPRC